MPENMRRGEGCVVKRCRGCERREGGLGSEDFVGLGGRTIWDGMRELDQYVG